MTAASLTASPTASCTLSEQARHQVRAGLWAKPTAGLDLRTDLPLYRIWREGQLVQECPDLHPVWRDDLVSFAIGCSFSFDELLIDQGIDVRHMACGCNVPMYRTNIPTIAAGRFAGPMVVSMRPMKAADAIRAVQIAAGEAGTEPDLGLPGDSSDLSASI